MIGNRDMERFCGQMGMLLKAGVNLPKTFEILMEQTDGSSRSRIDRLSHAVKSGESLAEGMRKESGQFPDIAIHAVRAGEEAGCLDTAFLKLAAYFRKREQIRGGIQKAMIYPVTLLTACVGIVIAMVAWVVPMYAEIFKSLDADMPPLTEAMLKAGIFLRQYGLWIMVCLVGTACALAGFFKKEQGKLLSSYLVLNLPGIKGIAKRYGCTQFCRNLSMMLTAGMPLLEALMIVSETMDNRIYGRILKSGIHRVSEGVLLSEVLKADRYFLPVVWHMTGIGEETGRLEEMLDSAADYCEDEADMMVKKLAAAAEPLVILMMAAVVAVVIGVIYSPVLRVYDSIALL